MIYVGRYIIVTLKKIIYIHVCMYMTFCLEKLEDVKRIIRGSKSKERQRLLNRKQFLSA